MAVLRDLLAVKGNHLVSIGPRASALDAAVLMNDHKIGALVVIEEGRLVGIFTERDVLRRIVADRRDPAETMVDEVMTREVVGCSPDTSVDAASTIMKERRVRHLPIIDDAGDLMGMVSIGDVNAFHASKQEQTIHHLNEYLYGRV